MDVLSSISGFIAYFFKKIEEHLKKPKLKVEFNYSKLDFVEFKLDERQGISYKLVMVKVSNDGKATAEECTAKAEIIRSRFLYAENGKILGEKDFPPNPIPPPMALSWIRKLESKDDFNKLFKPISIRANDCEFAELIEIFSFRTPYLRGDLKPLSLEVNDIIKVTIYCNNATSKSVCLKVKKLPTYEQTTSSNKDDYFEEIACPQL